VVVSFDAPSEVAFECLFECEDILFVRAAVFVRFALACFDNDASVESSLDTNLADVLVGDCEVVRIEIDDLVRCHACDHLISFLFDLVSAKHHLPLADINASALPVHVFSCSCDRYHDCE